MGQIIRCPLTGISCYKPIIIEEKSFFLAEAEKPEEDRKRRIKAINEAIEDEYKIRSALDEKGINAFTCKICEMIQTCAYGIADITQRNPNVLLELGMMIALGKPTIILSKSGEEQELKLPSDLNAIEVIPFTEYIDIIDQLREVVQKLPSPVSPLSPIQDLEKIQPQFADELRKMGADIVEEFKESMDRAKLDTILLREEKIEVPTELSERIVKLEETLKDLVRLGFTTDAGTAFLRGNFYCDQGKYEEALANYNWSLELRPDDPATLNNRGVTYAKLGRYDDALADFNRSLELTTDHPNTLANRGAAYVKLERYEEALANLNRSLELKPDDPATLCNRGVTYAHMERYDDALADFNRSLELRPDHTATLYNLACLFSLWRKTDEALAYLEKAISRDKKYREDAKTDKDFDNIRDDPRFKELVELED
ncbi:MAG TPA: tetratricopeptide repeat protein [Dehalococcoidia bacterium]|nr:tetratricopeptide repeat protein [Dehalococcoidia bacterium]